MVSEIVIQLPVFVYSSGNNGFALSTRDREMFDVRGIPRHITNQVLNGFEVADIDIDNIDEFKFGNVQGSALSYLEIMGTYSRIVMKTKFQLLTLGASVKYLIPHAAAGFKFHELNCDDADMWVENMTLEQLFDTSYFRYNVNTEYLFTSGDGNSPLFGFKLGSGWGSDIGLELKHTTDEVRQYFPNSPLSRCREVGYRYKLGFAFLDIGSVKLKSYASTVYNYRDSLSVMVRDGEVVVEGVGDATSKFWASASSTGGVVSKPNKIKLASAMAFQLEARLKEDVYFGVNYVHGFKRDAGVYGVKKPSVFAFTTRIEKEKFEFAIPISVYEFEQVHMGMSFRYAGFYMGTDMLGNYLFKNNVYGLDFFFGLKARIPEHKACHKKIKKG
ncbi:MAG: hypothetical protein HRT72_01535 [Flavobacteriales bacterium]|nr:hypothetical protein [Flavobacteriales bacterium]